MHRYTVTMRCNCMWFHLTIFFAFTILSCLACENGLNATFYKDSQIITQKVTDFTICTGYTFVYTSAKWESFFAAPVSGLYKFFFDISGGTVTVFINSSLVFIYTYDGLINATPNYFTYFLQTNNLHLLRVEFTAVPNATFCNFNFHCWDSNSCQFVTPSNFYLSNCPDYNNSVSVPTNFPSPPPQENYPIYGLVGDYFIGINFTEFLFRRTDPNLNLLFNEANLLYCTPVFNYFSAIWRAYLVVNVSGTRLLRIFSDDGFTLFINETLFIGRWDVQSADQSFNKSIKLEANVTYPIEIQYFNQHGTGKLEMYWDNDTTPIPTTSFLPRITTPPTKPPTNPPTNSPTNPPTNPSTNPPTDIMYSPTLLVVYEGNSTILGNQVITGDLYLTDNLTLIIRYGIINVTGCVSLGGNLEVYLSGDNVDLTKDGFNNSIVVIISPCIEIRNPGRIFENVSFYGLNDCQTYGNVRSVVDDGQLKILFDLFNICSKSLKGGVIAAIVVSVSLVILVAILALGVPRIRAFIFPYRLSKIEKNTQL